jgi:hypothetical protein
MNKFENAGYLKIIFWIGIIFIILAIGFYVANFYMEFPLNEKLSNDADDWSKFGAYFGGSLSPILAFLALIALLYSIQYQIHEFKESTAQLKYQNELLETQVKEARITKATEVELKNIEAINEFLIEIINILQGLFAIKSGYFNNLPADPVKRAVNFGPTVFSAYVSNFQISKLTFLEKNKPTRGSWGDIIHLSAVLNDYNSLLQALKTKNDLHHDIMQKSSNMLDSNLNTTVKLTINDPVLLDLLSRAGAEKGKNLIHLTNGLINMIDDAAINLSNIIKLLPGIAESGIAKSLESPEIILNEHPIIRYELDENQQSLLKKCEPVDICKLDTILKMSSS